ncbi:MAG: hypothetical protein MUC58_08270 [Rhizobiaceae bacterium]|jgi:hypothetical protein|nr:hypothetical protein [Rhizobiaceae bacterium]
MSTFLAYLGRLFMILLGFTLAVAVAGGVFTAALASMFDTGTVDGDLLDQAVQWAGMVVLVSGLAGTITLVPVVVLALLAELFSWRGLILHGVLGGALGAAATLLWDGQANDPDRAAVTLAGAAAGIVGAGVYWLVAGRNAGRLFDRIAAARQMQP